MDTYVVLRDLRREASGAPFGPMRGGGVLAAPPSTSDLQVEVERLDRRDRTELLRDPGVLALTPSMPTQLIEPFASDDDPWADAAGEVTWGIEAVGADASAFSGEDVTVAVLDTGIDADHQAFAGVDLIERDFSGDGNGDQQGHGTHCAGTVFGRDVDGRRIGVARGVPRALIGKVLGDDGSGSSEMIFHGITWAVENGADVVSMSLGFDFPGLVQQRVDNGWPADLATSFALEAYRGNLRVFDALMDLVRARAAFGSGAILVAAAGNESRRDVHPDYELAASLPAAGDGVVSVGALERSGGQLDVASFSNTFPVIAGPGVGVVSAAAGGGTRSLSGTSMACPHVAGVTALWWEAVRSSAVPPSPQTVAARLRSSARTDVFVPDLDVHDRGVGLVTAP